jgi:phosphoribosyl 1,2-cyclic phosphodiesterase
MKIHSIASSSSGNATRIYNDSSSFLIDCGISKKQLYSNEKFDVDAIFITHEHSDHIKGVNVLYNATGCKVYVYESVYNNKIDKFNNIDKEDLIFINAGEEIILNDFVIKPFSTRHDVENSVGFVITETPTNKKFGFLTDSGSITKLIKTELENCDGLFIESDYDEDELEKFADYSIELKTRIKSPWGHLSNKQAMDYIKENVDINNIKFILVGHLSPRTNSPDIVMSYINEYFPDNKNKFIICPTESELEL